MLPENEHKTASNPIIEVRHLKHGEWELYCSIRLEALQNAPYAFGSNYEREIAFTEEKWKDCAESRATGKESICVIAIDGSRGVGIAGGITPEDNPRVDQLVSMWVHEDVRGSNVAARLASQVEVWAFDRGSEGIVLGVNTGNLRATRFYEKMGFVVFDGEISHRSACEKYFHKPLAIGA